MRISQSMTSDLRVGDADRDRALCDLGRHFAEGRLTHLEHEERSAAALTARTRADLDVLFADLPLVDGPDRTPRWSWHRLGRSALWLALAALLAAATLRLGPVIIAAGAFVILRRLCCSGASSHHRRYRCGGAR